MPLLTRPAALLACCACLTTLPAAADIGAEATLGPITLQVVDLDPLDGLDPWVSYYWYGDYTLVWDVRTWQGLPANATFKHQTRGDTSCSLQIGNAVAGATAAFRPCAEQRPEELALVAGGSVRSVSTVAGADRAGFSADMRYQFEQWYESGYYVGPVALMVGPMTRVVATGDATIMTTASAATTDDELAGQVWLGFGMPGDPGTSEQTLEFDSGAAAPGIVSLRRTLTATFENLTTEMNGVAYRAGAAVRGSSHVQVVPEPATAALMLAGLALGGWRHRRKRLQA